jgi:hypothetical protein
MLFTAEVFHMNVMFSDGATRPIHVKSADLNFAVGKPNRSCSGNVGPKRPMTEPSRGATLKM